MVVSWAAQPPAVHAYGRGCTWVYETRNETAQIHPPLGLVVIGLDVGHYDVGPR
jgi:hypothetical protein